MRRYAWNVNCINILSIGVINGMILVSYFILFNLMFASVNYNEVMITERSFDDVCV